MEMVKKYGISLGYMVGIIIVGLFLFTLLNYFNIIGSKFLAIANMVLPLVAVFIGGLLLGKKSLKRGWLEGLKLALIYLIITIFITWICLGIKIEVKNLIYYLVITGATTLGGMIGISKSHLTIEQ